MPKTARTASVAAVVTPLVRAACLLALVGCGVGGVGGVVRPKGRTAAGAMGEDSCQVGARDQPLIVDWKAHERSNLEEAMADGVAVVAYDCHSIRVLSGCRVDGKYGFLATSKKEELIRLNDADEVKTNLPVLGPTLAAQLSLEFSRGATLDLATVLVGKRRTTHTHVSPHQLIGGDACTGATHFVRGAFVGAFAMGTSEKGQASTAASVLSGQSTSEKVASYRDGDVKSCGQAQAAATAPPESCAALVRLELFALSEDEEAPVAAATSPDPASPSIDAPTCAAGLVFSEGKCTTPAKGAVHQCESDDVADCAAQCDQGHLGSCVDLGFAYEKGHGVTKDEARGTKLYKKACDGGHPLGCVNLGVVYENGIGVPKDQARAVALFKFGCDAGLAGGCTALGISYAFGRGVAEDIVRAAQLYQLGCDGGDATGCNNLGVAYRLGKGVAKDDARSTELMKRACDGGHAGACHTLASRYDEAGDHVREVEFTRKACALAVADACHNLGIFAENGMYGVKKDVVVAAAFYKKGCDGGTALSCFNLGVFYDNGIGGLSKDVKRANQLFAKACKGGHKRGCEVLDKRGLAH